MPGAGCCCWAGGAPGVVTGGTPPGPVDAMAAAGVVAVARFGEEEYDIVDRILSEHLFWEKCE